MHVQYVLHSVPVNGIIYQDMLYLWWFPQLCENQMFIIMLKRHHTSTMRWQHSSIGSSLIAGSVEDGPIPGLPNLRIWSPLIFYCGALWKMTFTFLKRLQHQTTWRIKYEQPLQKLNILYCRVFQRKPNMTWSVQDSKCSTDWNLHRV